MPLQQTAHISFRYFIDFSDEFQTISSKVFIFNSHGISSLESASNRVVMHRHALSAWFFQFSCLPVEPLGGLLPWKCGSWYLTGMWSQKNYQKSYLDGTYNEYQQVNEVKLQISQNLPRLKSLQQYHGKNGNISYDFCRSGQSFYKDFMFKVRWYHFYGSSRTEAYHCKVFRINFFKMSQKLWELLSKSRITGN